MTDDMSDGVASSSESQSYDDDLLSAGCTDEVTAQLVAAGTVGIAAAAAIATGKKRKRPHSFETNPSIRKRQQTRILRKLKQTIDEYATRVGQQAVVLICTPGKPQNSFKVFGAKPLEDVVRNLKTMVMHELEQSLVHQAPQGNNVEDPNLQELPPLVIDGIPTPVEKMTQAQLRAFIPLMLKYATGRGKPGWGKEATRPVWWPEDLPWANVRSDVRPEEEKQRVSWTHALRQIVINCYKYHGRDDLMPTFNDDDDGMSKEDRKSQLQVQVTAQFAPAVVQTITNPDGSVSIIHVDPSALIQLPDGTQVAQIQGTHAEETQAVQTLAEVASQVGVVDQTTTIEGTAVPVATLNSDGQLIITEDGHHQAFPVTMYQTIVMNQGPSEVGQTMQVSISNKKTNKKSKVK
ncbi:hypothetical protein CHUAL_002816 [Chamberlinius hualienensis]